MHLFCYLLILIYCTDHISGFNILQSPSPPLLLLRPPAWPPGSCPSPLLLHLSTLCHGGDSQQAADPDHLDDGEPGRPEAQLGAQPSLGTVLPLPHPPVGHLHHAPPTPHHPPPHQPLAFPPAPTPLPAGLIHLYETKGRERIVSGGTCWRLVHPLHTPSPLFSCICPKVKRFQT